MPMDCAYSVPAYLIEHTRVEYQQSYRQFWGSIPRLSRTKRCKPEETFGRIYSNAVELGLPVNTYLITLFSWIENGHTKYKPGCLYFCGSVAAKDICRDELQRIKRRYNGQVPQRIATPVAVQVAHEIKQACQQLADLCAASAAVPRAVVLALNVNSLSPYYFAVHSAEWAVVCSHATAETCGRVQEVVDYLNRTGLRDEVGHLLQPL